MRYKRSSIARFIITILLTFIFIISENYILLPFATLQARAQDVQGGSDQLSFYDKL